MCRFKSGIILKSKVIVAQGEDDSHSALLDGLGIRDDYIGASKTFVRAELIPIGDKWWADPEKNPEQWKFIVDQDITPEWFSREAGEKEFREAVCSWWKKHVIVGGEFGELNDGHYYRMKDCKVKKLCGNTSVMLYKSMVKEMYDNATVQAMYENSKVQEMHGKATVKKMYENSTVQKMYDSAAVQKMCGNATVKEMYGNATVQEMYDSAAVQKMYDSAMVKEMYGSAMVKEMYDSATVQKMHGNVMVKEMYDSATVQKMHGNATVQEMYDNAMARCFESLHIAKIYVPKGSKIFIDRI